MKRFEIQKMEPAKKKFEIQKEAPPQKKRFEIIGNQNNESPDWFRQENSSDCGPCLVLNSLKLLNIPTEDTSVVSVRETVNRNRSHDRTIQPLSPEGWFTSRDVQEYLTQQGLSVQEYPCFIDEQMATTQTLKSLFESHNFDLIYITSGRHFRGILQRDGELQLLDSFSTGPQHISPEEAWKLIADTVSASTQTRTERVGIVKVTAHPNGNL